MSENLPPPENGTIDGVNKLLKLIIDASAAAAKGALVAVSPIFGWPIISSFVDYLILLLKNAIFKALSENTSILIITVEEAHNYHRYMDELAGLRKAQLTKDPNDDDEALKKAREALGNLIHFHA